MTPSTLRNIGIVAHVDAGKTTVTERILYYTGQSHRVGEVHDGNTTTDFTTEERNRGITIFSAAVSVQWREHQLNIIDTPGHIDFNIEVNRSLRVLDGAVVVFDGVAGVEPQSETNWHLADRYGVPRLCFVNKLDRVGADFLRVVEAIEARLDAHPLVLQLPIGEEDGFEGVIDLVEMKAYLWSNNDIEHTFACAEIPPALRDTAETYQQTLLDTVVEQDDDVMMQYLEGETPSVETIRRCIKQGTLASDFVPVLCGSAFKNKGIEPLLDAVVHYLPSPEEINLTDKVHDNLALTSDVNEPFAALAFKVVNDRFGSLTFLRVYRGKLNNGDMVLNAGTGKKERVGRMYEIQANQRQERKQVQAGDIVAFAGLKYCSTGDTLCAPNAPVVLERIEVPEPVIDIAIEARSSADQDQLISVLQSFVQEDPSLRLKYDKDSGQTILSGMGELQLEVNMHRLQTDYELTVNVGRPRVAYKETIAQSTELTYTHIKQTGGPGQFAKITLRFEPLPRGTGVEFESVIVSGHVPKEFIPSVESGILKAAQNGVLAGHPCVDFKATLLDGEYHEQDSSPHAFEWAAISAYREACTACQPMLLEPTMAVEVVLPSDFIGDCIGDFNRRRGVISNQDMQGNRSVIQAQVPLSEMFGYVTDLRGMTSGRGSFSMVFDRYVEVPERIMARMLGHV